jgi:hypothetical protein
MRGTECQRVARGWGCIPSCNERELTVEKVLVALCCSTMHARGSRRLEC